MAVSGICLGVPGKIPGKLREQKFLNRKMLYISRTSGTGKGKPAGDLGSTLPGTLSQPSVQGVFLKSTVTAFSFSES